MSAFPCPTCGGAGGFSYPTTGSWQTALRWVDRPCHGCQGTGEARCSWCGQPGADVEVDGEKLHARCVPEYRQVNPAGRESAA